MSAASRRLRCSAGHTRTGQRESAGRRVPAWGPVPARSLKADEPAGTPAMDHPGRPAATKPAACETEPGRDGDASQAPGRVAPGRVPQATGSRPGEYAPGVLPLRRHALARAVQGGQRRLPRAFKKTPAQEVADGGPLERHAMGHGCRPARRSRFPQAAPPRRAGTSQYLPGGSGRRPCRNRRGNPRSRRTPAGKPPCRRSTHYARAAAFSGMPRYDPPTVQSNS